VINSRVEDAAQPRPEVRAHLGAGADHAYGEPFEPRFLRGSGPSAGGLAVLTLALAGCDATGLSEYILLAASSLFVLVDPLATAPAFLAMTPRDSRAQRLRKARLACIIVAVVLLGFAFAGTLLFRIFGITMAAFQIAASVILFIIALDMLKVQRSRVQETVEETQAGAAKDDIAITPLAIPMLAGPGAISTTILLDANAKTLAQHIALYGCIVGVSLVSYLVLRVAVHGAHWLSPIAMSIAVRIMGLLLSAIAIQFLLDGIRAFVGP
jgi:multiple antibiotic resistance protein